MVDNPSHVRLPQIMALLSISSIPPPESRPVESIARKPYHTRLLAAAYRHHMHWSELIGGDLILTIPYSWQVLFNASNIAVKNRIDDPVAPEIVAELYSKFPDFRRAYDVDGISVADFDRYGATVRTLRSFVEAYRDVLAVVRDVMLAPPEKA